MSRLLPILEAPSEELTKDELLGHADPTATLQHLGFTGQDGYMSKTYESEPYNTGFSQHGQPEHKYPDKLVIIADWSTKEDEGASYYKLEINYSVAGGYANLLDSYYDNPVEFIRALQIATKHADSLKIDKNTNWHGIAYTLVGPLQGVVNRGVQPSYSQYESILEGFEDAEGIRDYLLQQHADTFLPKAGLTTPKPLNWVKHWVIPQAGNRKLVLSLEVTFKRQWDNQAQNWDIDIGQKPTIYLHMTFLEDDRATKESEMARAYIPYDFTEMAVNRAIVDLDRWVERYKEAFAAKDADKITNLIMEVHNIIYSLKAFDADFSN